MGAEFSDSEPEDTEGKENRADLYEYDTKHGHSVDVTPQPEVDRRTLTGKSRFIPGSGAENTRSSRRVTAGSTRERNGDTRYGRATLVSREQKSGVKRSLFESAQPRARDGPFRTVPKMSYRPGYRPKRGERDALTTMWGNEPSSGENTDLSKPLYIREDDSASVNTLKVMEADLWRDRQAQQPKLARSPTYVLSHPVGFSDTFHRRNSFTYRVDSTPARTRYRQHSDRPHAKETIFTLQPHPSDNAHVQRPSILKQRQHVHGISDNAYSNIASFGSTSLDPRLSEPYSRLYPRKLPPFEQSKREWTFSQKWY